MNTDEQGCEWEAITERVIGCAFAVANALGAGFLERVYENALARELQLSDVHCRQQHPVTVWYRGAPVGDYVADLIVEDKVLVELKACKGLDDIHMAQCMNYLRATHLPVCLLINFGKPKVQLKRILNPASPEGWVRPRGDSMINEDE